MKTVVGVMRKTCVAFAFNASCPQKIAAYALRNKFPRRSISSSMVLYASPEPTFIPPEPPASKGTSVFPDIQFPDSFNESSESFVRNNDPSAVFVVSGASRGIGLQFVKTLFDRTRGTIVACCRSPHSAIELNEVVESSDRVQVVQLDIENQQSIDQATSIIKNRFDRIDLLLNVAGILGDARTTPGPERSISNLERDWMEKTMAVNVIGPMMLCKELVPLLKSKTIRTSKATPEGRPTSIVANLGARVGSVSDNELGGWYSYRISKAALNQATRTMSHELKRQGTWSIALHPGTTNTDLSKPFQRNVQDGRLFPVAFTVGKLLDVIDSMQEQNSGGLYDWAGKAIPF